jgi:hypothetical protein
LAINVGGKVAGLIERLGPSGEQSGPISAQEEYAQAVLFAASEFVATVDQMKYAVRSLAGFRRVEARGSRFEPTRLDHLIYHLENHIIRTVTLIDRSLQLTNIVYGLGIPERGCSETTVAENAHLKSSAAAKELRRLLALVKPLRQQRNVIVHRRRYRDDTMRRIGTFFVLEQIEQGDEPAKRVTPNYRWLYKALTDKYVAEKKRELAESNAQAEEICAALFTALEVEFDRQWQSRSVS